MAHTVLQLIMAKTAGARSGSWRSVPARRFRELDPVRLRAAGELLGAAEGDAVAAVDLVGGDANRSRTTRWRNSAGKKRSSRRTRNLVGTFGHDARGRGCSSGVADWSRPRHSSSAARSGGTSWRNRAMSSALNARNSVSSGARR
jgi:hypothetical protein